MSKKIVTKYEYERKIVKKANYNDLSHLAKFLTDKHDNRRLEYYRKKSHAIKVFSIWPQVAGELLASHSSPYFVNQFELRVICDNGIFASQIQLNSHTLLKKINNLIDIKLNRVKVKVGAIDWDKLNYEFDKENSSELQSTKATANLKMQDIMSPDDKMDVKTKNSNFEIILSELNS